VLQRINDSFVELMDISPIGRLFLERLEMTPVGIEHGELVHSVPLTPMETVNIAHKEWAVTEQTFETIVSDSLEGFVEKGVTEKAELSDAVLNESKHSSSLDVNGSVSASYNGAGFSVSAATAVDYQTKSDDTKSEKISQAHAQTITQTASSRTRKEHKQSFKVSAITGTSDLAVRTLTNPSPTNAIRVDYFPTSTKMEGGFG
jgi:hypothetical protein